MTGDTCPAPASSSSASGPRGWSASIPPLTVGRYFPSVTTGCDGRVYVIGGVLDAKVNTATHVEPTVEVYDPRSNTWSQTAPMLTSRQAPAVTAGIDGRIYAIGGVHGSNFEPVATVEVYDPETNKWSQVAPLPQPGAAGAVTGKDGRIWVIAERDTYVYSPEANSWATAAPMPTERFTPQVVMAPDGMIWVLGGISDGVVGVVEVYDPSSNTWRTSSPMPNPQVDFPAVAVPDGRILVLGGSRGARQQKVSIFDPATNRWTSGPDMPIGLEGHSATVDQDGRVLVVSGHAVGSPSTELNRQVLVLTP
ncbi:MAG: hypothetical protein L0H84_13170 [Pseudonocardia sp.]|nr:hypothetical protein [Pseudonocardia sp.]